MLVSALQGFFEARGDGVNLPRLLVGKRSLYLVCRCEARFYFHSGARLYLF